MHIPDNATTNRFEHVLDLLSPCVPGLRVVGCMLDMLREHSRWHITPSYGLTMRGGGIPPPSRLLDLPCGLYPPSPLADEM